MLKEKNVILTGDFLYLLRVLFLGALNDNVLKNAFMVLIAFSSYHILNISEGHMLSLAAIIYITPFIIFSSYAGKLADSSDKARIIRIIKLCEIIIIVVAVIAFIYHQVAVLLLCLFCMGIHSAFFGPIKYAIVPDYLPKISLVIANGYIEIGTFSAILLGQTIGSLTMANGHFYLLFAIMLFISCNGYYLSTKLHSVPVINHELQFSKNIIKDSWLMYKLVTKDKRIALNLHSISWFWAIGLIFTTELPILIKNYIGGNAHVFSMLLVLFTPGIGIGSLICSKLSHSVVKRHYALLGGLCMSLGFFILLLMHRNIETHYLNLNEFIHSCDGVLLIINCLFIGLAAGFYSVTCYNEIQLISPNNIRAQIISANNILNSIYMVVAMIISSLLLTVVSVWWVLMIVAILNILFMSLYIYKSFLNYSAS